jgi:hypothetical protein
MKSQLNGPDDDVASELSLLGSAQAKQSSNFEYISSRSPFEGHLHRRSLHWIAFFIRVALTVAAGASFCIMLYRSAVVALAAVAVDAVVVERQATSSPSGVPDYFVTVPELYPGMQLWKNITTALNIY